jgi:hypothetical protein
MKRRIAYAATDEASENLTKNLLLAGWIVVGIKSTSKTAIAHQNTQKLEEQVNEQKRTIEK